MEITIQSQDISLTAALRDYLRRRFALNKFADRIQRVTIRLADINGPRGGLDKRCRIQIELPSMPSIVTEDIDQNLYVAVNRSSARASRAVLSKLKRQQVIKRAGY